MKKMLRHMVPLKIQIKGQNKGHSLDKYQICLKITHFIFDLTQISAIQVNLAFPKAVAFLLAF